MCLLLSLVPANLGGWWQDVHIASPTDTTVAQRNGRVGRTRVGGGGNLGNHNNCNSHPHPVAGLYLQDPASLGAGFSSLV